MDWLDNLQKNLKNQIKEIPNMVDDGFMQNEELIIALNVHQIEMQKDVNGEYIKGVYTKNTEEIARSSNPSPLFPKKAGATYNLFWTGVFVEGLMLRRKKKAVFDIYSKGIPNSGKKRDFFNRMNVMGLDYESEKILFDKVGYNVINRVLTNIYK